MNAVGSPPLVLASASAARARILAAAGVSVTVDPAHIDEGEIKSAFRHDRRPAADCAAALAELKAQRVAARHPDALVIGSDQLLDCAGTWLDKPRDLAEARAQLQFLRGRRHELVTAICVIVDSGVAWHKVEHARLTMRNFSDAFLEEYLAAMGDDLRTLVGAYALEGLGGQLFAAIDGDYFAILGLPLLPLLDFLRGRGAVAR